MSRELIARLDERIARMEALPSGEVKGMQSTFFRFWYVEELRERLAKAEELLREVYFRPDEPEFWQRSLSAFLAEKETT